jgi:hypothetical protein
MSEGTMKDLKERLGGLSAALFAVAGAAPT